MAEVFRKDKEGHVEALKLLKLESGEHSPLLTGLAKIKKDTLRKDTLKKEVANTIVGIEAAEGLGMSNLKLLYQDRQAYLMEMYDLLYKDRPKIGLRVKELEVDRVHGNPCSGECGRNHRHNQFGG